jgi:hypothetical protein
MFNAIEQMGLRVAKAFENNIDDEQGWHTGLLKRLSLDIPGIRPALLPAELRLPLHELKGFRHVLQGEPQRDFMLRPDFLNGISLLNKYNFTYDIFYRIFSKINQIFYF